MSSTCSLPLIRMLLLPYVARSGIYDVHESCKENFTKKAHPKCGTSCKAGSGCPTARTRPRLMICPSGVFHSAHCMDTASVCSPQSLYCPVCLSWCSSFRRPMSESRCAVSWIAATCFPNNSIYHAIEQTCATSISMVRGDMVCSLLRAAHV